jgi:hypothetical protein
MLKIKKSIRMQKVFTDQKRWYVFPVLKHELCLRLIEVKSLTVSESKKRMWLKWAGITSGLWGLVLLAISIYHFYISGNLLSSPSLLTKIYFWTLYIGNLVPVLFILNFSDESKHAAKEKLNRTDQISETWLGLASFLCLCGHCSQE